MIHEPPAYLRKIITLRLRCRSCETTRLHRCRAVGVFKSNHQQVETICLHCERMVVK